jgi:hypothetical protein
MFNRRQFLGLTPIPFLLSFANKGRAIVEDYSRRDSAISVFDKLDMPLCSIPEFPLENNNTATYYINDANKVCPTFCNNGHFFIYIPYMDAGATGSTREEAKQNVWKKVDYYCTETLIAAANNVGQKIQFYKRTDMSRRHEALARANAWIRATLGEESNCKILNLWYKNRFYRVGVKCNIQDFVMPIKMYPSIWKDPTATRIEDSYYGWTELGIAVLNSKNVAIAEEI